MEVWRCDITGNPVGTDTRMIGAPDCGCQGCRAADKIDGLEEDLREAVMVAFNRGAHIWVRMNYPHLYRQLSAALNDQERT